ncbi:Protein BUD31 homolog 2 [Galdieria sulphuraria]|nr:Protein BUD31 homolog 2 [Galdieria sulphuraria]
MSWRHRIRQKKLPKGFELIETQLEKFEDEMREIMNDTMEDKMRNELTWKVHKLHWKKNRFIFNLYYKEKAISKELFDFLVKEKVVDDNLISKWRKPGYENLCSLAVISKTNTNFRTAGVAFLVLQETVDPSGQLPPEEGTVDEAEEKQSDEEKAETEEGQLTDKTFEEEKGETREETTQDSERTKRRKKE